MSGCRKTRDSGALDIQMLAENRRHFAWGLLPSRRGVQLDANGSENTPRKTQWGVLIRRAAVKSPEFQAAVSSGQQRLFPSPPVNVPTFFHIPLLIAILRFTHGPRNSQRFF